VTPSWSGRPAYRVAHGASVGSPARRDRARPAGEQDQAAPVLRHGIGVRRPNPSFTAVSSDANGGRSTVCLGRANRWCCNPAPPGLAKPANLKKGGEVFKYPGPLSLRPTIGWIRLLAVIALVLLVAALVARRLGSSVGPSRISIGVDTGSLSPSDPRAAIFVRRGCEECHAIAALGVKANRDVGPDLTFASQDVVTRYGVSLRSFFRSPPGIMGVVLASHIHLTQTDRDSMCQVLEAVYHEHLAEMDEEVPSFPPAHPRPSRQ
jgi:hypothetical protein